MWEYVLNANCSYPGKQRGELLLGIFLRDVFCQWAVGIEKRRRGKTFKVLSGMTDNCQSWKEDLPWSLQRVLQHISRIERGQGALTLFKGYTPLCVKK